MLLWRTVRPPWPGQGQEVGGRVASGGAGELRAGEGWFQSNFISLGSGMPFLGFQVIFWEALRPPLRGRWTGLGGLALSADLMYMRDTERPPWKARQVSAVLLGVFLVHVLLHTSQAKTRAV